jgi:hypothetical protein
LAGPVSAFGVRYTWPLLWLGMRIEADIATPGAGATQHEALHALAATLQTDTPPAQAYQALIAAESARLNHRDEITA